MNNSPWEIAEAVMGVSRRVLLHGPPGTGKTYHAVNAAIDEDQKIYQITMTDETPAAELRGHYVAKGNEWVWTDGPAITAWREGARLVINEIDRASEDALSFLYVIMDDPEFAKTTLPTNEVVKPKKGFQIVATMNGVPEDLPEALQDRFPVDIRIEEVHSGAIEQLPEDLREAAKNTSLKREGGRRLSIRSWLEFAKLRAKFDDDKLAAEAIFGQNASAAMMALQIGKNASPPFTLTDVVGMDLNDPNVIDGLVDLRWYATAIHQDRVTTADFFLWWTGMTSDELDKNYPWLIDIIEVDGTIVLRRKDGVNHPLDDLRNVKFDHEE